MNFIVILSLIAQSGTSYPAPRVNIDEPVIQVTGTGTVSIEDQATAHDIILYADSYDEDKKAARDKAEDMKEEILKRTKMLGGTAKDITLINLNTLDPIEDDPYYRVEQDIQILLHEVEDISKAKEQYLMIDGVQIGSVTPVMGEMKDHAPAIARARHVAVRNARDAAAALAMEMNVVLGEPLYIAEQIAYPAPGAYESMSAGMITVTVTVCFRMIEKK